MDTIIQMIEAEDFAGAIEALKVLQSAVGWRYDNEGNDLSMESAYCLEQSERDAACCAVLTDLYAAQQFQDADRQHFKRVAILRLRVLGGDGQASAELERAITAGALSAEAELRRFSGAQN